MTVRARVNCAAWLPTRLLLGSYLHQRHTDPVREQYQTRSAVDVLILEPDRFLVCWLILIENRKWSWAAEGVVRKWHLCPFCRGHLRVREVLPGFSLGCHVRLFARLWGRVSLPLYSSISLQSGRTNTQIEVVNVCSGDWCYSGRGKQRLVWATVDI